MTSEEQPGPEQPGPEQPGPEQPGSEQPGSEQPGPEQIGPEPVVPGLSGTDHLSSSGPGGRTSRPWRRDRPGDPAERPPDRFPFVAHSSRSDHPTWTEVARSVRDRAASLRLVLDRWPWRRHPGAQLIVAATVVVVVVVVAGLWVRHEPGEPQAVVRAYLAAIRAGEVEDALRIAGDPEIPEDVDDTFLTAGALSDDWRVGQVVRRYPWQDGSPVVDVTLRAPDGATAQYRFRLSRQDGAWSIDQPFAIAHIGSLPAVDFLEINGVVRPVAPAGPESGSPERYLLFPGAYRLYPSLDGLIADQDAIVMVGPARAPTRIAPRLELTGELQRAAQRAVTGYIDECATSTSLVPDGCPFGAGDSHLPYGDAGYRIYRDPADISWEVVTYPDVLLTFDGRFRVVNRHQGSVQITGTGVPLVGEEREPFQAECAIEVSGLPLTLTRAPEFDVVGRDVWNTCFS